MDDSEKLTTYLNVSGYPIMRRCFNCKHWQNGACSLMTLTDTYNGEKINAITKEYYMCIAHRFKNESWLKKKAPVVNLKSSLKPKEDLYITRFEHGQAETMR